MNTGRPSREISKTTRVHPFKIELRASQILDVEIVGDLVDIYYLSSDSHVMVVECFGLRCPATGDFFKRIEDKFIFTTLFNV